jgi:hypothetical protein
MDRLSQAPWIGHFLGLSINDPYDQFLNSSPAVADYFGRPDVQKYASIIRYEWTDSEDLDRNSFRE